SLSVANDFTTPASTCGLGENADRARILLRWTVTSCVKASSLHCNHPNMLPILIRFIKSFAQNLPFIGISYRQLGFLPDTATSGQSYSINDSQPKTSLLM